MSAATSKRGYFQIEVLGPGARAVRVLKPDFARGISLCEPLTDSGAYQDFQESLLAGLPPGETVVLDFQRLKPGMSSAFYRFLLCLRHAVLQHQGRLILCHLHPSTAEVLNIVQAHRIFTIVGTERDALPASGEGVPGSAAGEEKRPTPGP